MAVYEITFFSHAMLQMHRQRNQLPICVDKTVTVNEKKGSTYIFLKSQTNMKLKK